MKSKPPSASYEPAEQLWVYSAENPTDLFSLWFSSAQCLPSGNTIICNGQRGMFYEVTPNKQVVWSLQNPYPFPDQYNPVFKIWNYMIIFPNGPDLECGGGLNWTKVNPGSTQTGTFSVRDVGEPSSLLDWRIESILPGEHGRLLLQTGTI
jgi:hypothetical protein